MIQIIGFVGSWNKDPTKNAQGWMSRASLSGAKALSFSAVLTVTTFPLVAFYFNQVPWLGVLTNLGAIPFTGFILVPFGLGMAIWTMMTGAEVLAWGPGLEYVFTWLVTGVRWCATIPGAQWAVAAPSIPAMMLFYAGAVGASLPVLSKRWRLAGTGLALALMVWWLAPPSHQGDGDHWRVTFLDVGQGDSALVELPDGQTVLIDGGARHDRFDMGRSVVAPFLWNRGISHINYVIGTHQQMDHVGGLIWIIQHLSVGQFLDQGVEREEQFVTDLTSALHSGVAPVDLTKGQAGSADAAALAQRVVYFDFDSFVIKDEYRPLLEAHAKALSANRNKRMAIEGHTDERGGREYNLALGQKRAEALKKMLLLLGAREEQVEAVSLGEEKPRCSEAGEACWSKNRRVEFVILKRCDERQGVAAPPSPPKFLSPPMTRTRSPARSASYATSSSAR